VDGQAAHAQAAEPSVVAFMKREEMDRFVLEKLEVGLRMMDLLAERLSESSNERMAEIAHKELLSRLAGQVLRLLEDEGVVDRRGGLQAAGRPHPRGARRDGGGQPGGGDPRLG
jgi:CRP-like cAMP-binding protein